MKVIEIGKKGSGREKMWTVMKALREFHIKDVAMLSETNYGNAKIFIRRLVQKGVVQIWRKESNKTLFRIKDGAELQVGGIKRGPRGHGDCQCTELRGALLSLAEKMVDVFAELAEILRKAKLEENHGKQKD